MQPCIVIVGKIGSGKTVISKQVAERLGYSFFEVSDVVRDLTGRDRNTIRLNNLTGETVGREIAKRLNESVRYIVSGVRQKEVIEHLEQKFEVLVLKIEVPIEVRVQRVIQRDGSTKDVVLEGDKLDAQLGFQDIMDNIKGYVIHGNKSLESNIQDIITVLKREGVIT